MGEAAFALGCFDALGKASRIIGLFAELAQNGLAEQRGVEFTRHESGEAFDLPLFHLNPFGMRARQDDGAILDAGAERQRFFAAHDIGCACCIAC